MSTLCGWASQDERGKISGGKAGDQTGKEVRTGPLYEFGQTIVIRYRDVHQGIKAGQINKAICNNKYVGYDQSERADMHDELKKVHWDVSKLKKPCETDCSQMQVTIANAVGIKVANSTTETLVENCKHTGKFDILAYKKGMKLHAGDMLVHEGHHVIGVISA